MNVSRETCLSFLDNYKKEIGGGGATLFDDVAVLPLLVEAYRGSCLVVDDGAFDVVFSVLYRSGLDGFCALSGRESKTPGGFLSPLEIAKNAFSLYKNNLPLSVLVVDRSFFNGGHYYDFLDEVFCEISHSSDRDVVGSALFDSKMERVPVVFVPGTYAERGAVYDLFPVDSSYPVRVDFSFEDDVKIYVFDVDSQMSTKEIVRFVFRVSVGGKQKRPIKSLLGGVPVISVGLDYLGNRGVKKKTSVKYCSYESYVKKNGVDFYVDPLLDSGGVCLNGVFYIPPWFIKNKGFSKDRDRVVSRSFGFNDFSSISIGDYLIHEDFGVGCFRGIVCDDNENDSFVSLQYEDGFVSVGVENLSILSFYDAADSNVSLNSISKRGLWQRRVSGVSKKIDHFVEGLLKKHLLRLSFTKDRTAFDEGLLASFLSSFKYTDTKDQALAFNDICLDLQSKEPMDRLLCGDVGFGKTEIAIRAAFLSLLMGGRVVVLAPTTILCYQLFKSFLSRLNDFSINVEMVSRLVGESNINSILERFNAGVVDVLVCTQKIFTYIDRVDFVSMVIVDEEHRFGVKHKELFVEKFPSIDVLSMSATPIPRSLQQAFSGIKTISTIATPPINRRPIQTLVVFFDLEKIVEFILVEIHRGGQVYFLHNNISSIKKIERLLVHKIPGVAIGVIHGKMPPKKIEGVLNDFVVGKYDVLVSTTIIESGLDIPNVNTIIINNAHLFGLSQLHQIRGRVGRHSRQAFAYLLIPKSLKLNVNARKRLKAIEENVSLGSGHNIASKDLDIRGAGSVFGYAQSGGSSVGFDLYNKLLADSFSHKNNVVNINPAVDVFVVKPCFPVAYIPDEELRLSLYKKLSSLQKKREVVVFRNEILNRFGVFPLSVENLLKTQELKVLCQKALVSSVSRTKGSCFVLFLPGKHVLDVGLFLSFIKSFFYGSGLDFSVKQKSGNRVQVSFVGTLNDEDVSVLLINLLNKFINLFLKECE